MSARYRLVFFMQQVLGHVTHSANLESIVRADPEVEPVWVPITYWQVGGVIERLPVVPPHLKGSVRAVKEVWRILLRERADGIVFNTSALATSVTSWIKRVPTAISLDVTPRQFDREAAFFGHRADGDTPLARWKHRVNCRVFDRSALLVPWSSWVRTSLVEEYRVAPAKIEIIPPGVDLAGWDRVEQPRSGLPQVLFVGGDFARKGGDSVVEWFRQRGRGLCELRIVTSDPAATALEAPDIHVHRDLRPNSQALRQLYWRSDLLVLPSRSEPFGIACVEALAASLPTVVTAVGGLTDIVEDGVNGYVIPPGDAQALDAALQALLRSPERRLSMGAAGRRMALERFDAERNGRRFLALIKAAVERARSGSRGLAGEAAAREA